MSTYLLTLPLSVVYNVTKAGKEHKFPINLNSYREKGTCYYVVNKAKQVYQAQLTPQLASLPKFTNPIRVTYEVYKKDRRDYDINNVCSIADKFLMDALVEAGKLEDDNYRLYLGMVTRHGGFDKDNPRVEAIIEEVCC